MANSKTHAVKRKHLKRQRAAKEQVRAHRAGKLESDNLTGLAKRYLLRTARISKPA